MEWEEMLAASITVYMVKFCEATFSALLQWYHLLEIVHKNVHPFGTTMVFDGARPVEDAVDID